ncbi:MAG TPA: hypothetical protein VFQ85_01460 [Mycobacteriales bacterium]|nr:hypothetical protein [Mycobacteriales bacterium]
MTRRAVGPLAGALALFALGLVLVPPDRLRVDRVAALAVAAYAFARARRLLGAGARPRAVAPGRAGDHELAPPEEQDVRLARLDASLARATESPEQFAHATRPMLRRLATERLLTRHGVDVTADPAGARRLMGEELWEIYSTPADRRGAPPDAARLRLLVERLERL